MEQLLSRQIAGPYKIKHLTCNRAIPLLGLYNNNNISKRYMHTTVHSNSTLKPKCEKYQSMHYPSPDKCIDKMQCVHVVEQCLALKWSEIYTIILITLKRC